MKTLNSIFLILMSFVHILNAQSENDSDISARVYNAEYAKTISILWPAFQDTSQRLHIPTAREVSTPLGTCPYVDERLYARCLYLQST